MPDCQSFRDGLLELGLHSGDEGAVTYLIYRDVKTKALAK